MLPFARPTFALVAAISLAGCASGSMPTPDDVGIAEDSGGSGTQGLPNPDPTFDSVEDDGSGTAPTTGGVDPDTGGGPTGNDEAGATDSTSGGGEDDTTDSGTTSMVEPGDSSSSDGAQGESSGGESTGVAVMSIDVSGWSVVQANSSREFVFPEGTVIDEGTTIVIGRDASQLLFEDWWGVTLGEDVVYFDAEDTFPAINGGETFTLRDDSDIAIDGPTPALTVSTNQQRNDATADPTQASTWDESPNPNADGTPGVDTLPGAAAPTLVLTEMSDTIGSGAFAYEFVELRFVPASA
ncbi:MAG: hypothetical protein AAF721_35550 [Myxococcota bacterium]